MNRKEFLKTGILGLGGIALADQFTSNNTTALANQINDDNKLDKTPEEMAGPFPTKTPAQLIQENIVADRFGMPLVMKFIVQSKQNNYQPLMGAMVDVWHCDADGYYSEYGRHWLQIKDFRKKHFLRGRQQTNKHGQASFISIFPGWYGNRAPHIHLEVLDNEENSLLTTQIAFDKKTCDEIYTTEYYHGPAKGKNEDDMVFADSLVGNMVDSMTGNINDGYTLVKKLIV